MDQSKSRSRGTRTAVAIAIAIAAGILTFILGLAWLIYSYMVDLEAPYFAIPLVFSVPVIVAVTIRALGNDD